jgi:hypothetical protein
MTDGGNGALLQAGCDDAVLGRRAGLLYLDFERSAPSQLEAILSAITDVENSGAGVRVVRVEPDELVTITQIAKRIGWSREYTRLLALGQRGPGGFPPPASGFMERSPVYRWSDVAGWLVSTTKAPPGLDLDDVHEIGAVNAVLDVRRYEERLASDHRLRRLLDLSLQETPSDETPNSPDPRGRAAR